MRCLWRQCAPVRFATQHARQRVRYIFAGKRALPGEHLVEHAAERPDVAALLGRPSLRLLGAYIRRRPENRPNAGHHRGRGDRRRLREPNGTRGRWCLRQLRQSEIQYLHHPVGPQLDVGGLQVPVNDTLLVRGFEGFGDLPGNRKCFVEWNRSLGDPVRQRWAFDQFQH